MCFTVLCREADIKMYDEALSGSKFYTVNTVNNTGGETKVQYGRH